MAIEKILPPNVREKVLVTCTRSGKEQVAIEIPLGAYSARQAVTMWKIIVGKRIGVPARDIFLDTNEDPKLDWTGKELKRKRKQPKTQLELY